MPTTGKGRSKPTKKTMVPKTDEPKPEILIPDVLADFTQWVKDTTFLANNRQKSLIDSGSTDYQIHKTIIHDVLKRQFQRAKWR